MKTPGLERFRKHSMAVDAQVATYRTKLAGVDISGMGLKKTSVAKRDRISLALIRRLAGL